MLRAMGTKRTNSRPYHQQIANVLRGQIVEAPTGSAVRLPPEREMARIHCTSRECIRKALAVLETEGLLERTPSRGTWTVPAGIAAYRRVRKTGVIKVVTGWQDLATILPSTFHGRIYQGILDRAEAANYTVSMRGLQRSFPPLGPDFTPEDPGQIVGVILVGIADDRIVTMHADAGYPVVCVDYWAGDARVDAVLVDCFGEGKLMIDFLLSLGHRDFFFVGNLHSSSASRPREADAELLLAGCQRALREAGLSIPDERVWWCTQAPGQAGPIVDQLLALPRRPTAGVVFSSYTAERIREGLAARGVLCPRDVSLICKTAVDNLVDAASVQTNAYLLGQCAVEQLLDRASGKRSGSVVLALRSTLQRGSSVRNII